MSVAAGTPAVAAPVSDPSSPVGKDAAWTSGIHAVDATPAVLELMKAQAAVDQVADRIDVASQGGTATSGIAGVVVDPARHTVKFYWHGDPTAAVSREISAAGALGVSVTVTQAPYTRNQLLDETKRLAGLNAAQPASAGARVVSVAPMPDGSGA